MAPAHKEPVLVIVLKSHRFSTHPGQILMGQPRQTLTPCPVIGGSMGLATFWPVFIAE
jgi:hypothetical protein